MYIETLAQLDVFLHDQLYRYLLSRLDVDIISLRFSLSPVLKGLYEDSLHNFYISVS